MLIIGAFGTLEVDIHLNVVGSWIAGVRVPLPDELLPSAATSPAFDWSSSSPPNGRTDESQPIGRAAGVEVPDSPRLPRVRGACRLRRRSTASFYFPRDGTLLVRV